ncbi:uncharacterized protein UDID_17247 [Ustilago sp. UG-2017a]|nr:uncharacterized protein UDID_17247 [Ustilago sp. UG-2017a]
MTMFSPDLDYHSDHDLDYHSDHDLDYHHDQDLNDHLDLNSYQPDLDSADSVMADCDLAADKGFAANTAELTSSITDAQMDGSTGIGELVETSRKHGRSTVSMETMDSYEFTCKGGPGPYARRARHSHKEDQAQGAGTATKRTKLKEHADGYHSGARETRAKGTITGQREGAVYRRPASRS